MTIIKLDWKVAELIASYYEFPTAVFLLEEREAQKILHGTRRTQFRKAHEKLEQIKEILGDNDGK